MDNNRAFRDYAMFMVIETLSRIKHPPIQANNFEIKPVMIQMVQGNQFCGLPSEGPNSQISNFY